MSNEDAADKSFDPTPKKLEDARKRGEVAKSVDLLTATSYATFTILLIAIGAQVIRDVGTNLMVLLDQSHGLADLMFGSDTGAAPLSGIIADVMWHSSALFVLPAIAVLLCVVVQRALVFAPTKLKPKLSRVSLIQNAKNKFGRSGLFEFFKSFVKLVIYSVSLGVFLNANLSNIVMTVQTDSRIALHLLAELTLSFLFVVLAVAMAIGVVDAIFQHQEHIRKNRMSRKEIMDEMKDSEGDPHLKQERRNRAQAMAAAQMMADVPNASVVIVNPTHYAVALNWSREPGSAPVCVAKGVDEIALKIREIAQEAGVPIHSDPPTARGLHASTEIGSEISTSYYREVAAAIRFADEMRLRAKSRVI